MRRGPFVCPNECRGGRRVLPGGVGAWPYAAKPGWGRRPCAGAGPSRATCTVPRQGMSIGSVSACRLREPPSEHLQMRHAPGRNPSSRHWRQPGYRWEDEYGVGEGAPARAYGGRGAYSGRGAAWARAGRACGAVRGRRGAGLCDAAADPAPVAADEARRGDNRRVCLRSGGAGRGGAHAGARAGEPGAAARGCPR